MAGRAPAFPRRIPKSVFGPDAVDLLVCDVQTGCADHHGGIGREVGRVRVTERARCVLPGYEPWRPMGLKRLELKRRNSFNNRSTGDRVASSVEATSITSRCSATEAANDPE